MKVMVIGGGGREHAIIKKLKESPEISRIYALPGNGGIAADAECVNIGAKDIAAQVAFAQENNIGFAVVAPDDPLVLGAVDALQAAGIPCFGPSKAAAAIEGSKIFSKNLMKKYAIPTASYECFTDMNKALQYVSKQSLPVVIKADGLALGKGVVIATTADEAADAVRQMMQDKRFGDAGTSIVVEEFLTGPEVSVLCFTDGMTIKPMVSSMDHKRALDADRGLNTGGMGTIAPNPYYTKQIAARCMDEIFLPTVAAMNAESRSFRGCLYFGLMLTENGPKVIEYNCRFGDPETQVVLPLLKSDLFSIMKAVNNGTLADCPVEFEDKFAACVVMASAGYPQSYETGKPLDISTEVADNVYVAGAKIDDSGRLVTAGGRVLGAVAVSDSLQSAITNAYKITEKISFENAYYRSDIGARALAATRED